MEMRKKSIQVTDSQYPVPHWPLIATCDQQAILELLCKFLSPVGHHRWKHARRSKGKRFEHFKAKRKRSEISTMAPSISAPEVPPAPELARSIAVGFNSTISLLQQQARPGSDAAKLSSSIVNVDVTKRIAVVFVCTLTLPALLTSFIPTLVAAASAQHPTDPPIRLIALPREAARRLAEALSLPSAGFVSLFHKAPGGQVLIDKAQKISLPVDATWLKQNTGVEYMPVSTKATSVYQAEIRSDLEAF